MSEHPNIVIKWDVKDSDDIMQQMQRMQSANQKLPDVIQDEVQLARAYHDAGLVMPIDDQMKKWQQEDAASYDLVLPSAWEEARIDGQTLGMSITANFDVLYYNTEWAKQAGVQFPVRTYDDLFAAAQKLKAARPDKFPFSIQALAGEGVTALLNMFVGAGVPFDGATPDLKSPQAQYILDWFKRARDEGLIPPDAISWGEAESRGVFVSGDAALLIDGFTTAGDFADVGGFDYGTSWSNTLLPAETGKGHSEHAPAPRGPGTSPRAPSTLTRPAWYFAISRRRLSSSGRPPTAVCRRGRPRPSTAPSWSRRGRSSARTSSRRSSTARHGRRRSTPARWKTCLSSCSARSCRAPTSLLSSLPISTSLSWTH